MASHGHDRIKYLPQTLSSVHRVYPGRLISPSVLDRGSLNRLLHRRNFGSVFAGSIHPSIATSALVDRRIGADL